MQLCAILRYFTPLYATLLYLGRPLHLYTEPRLMSSTEVKTYRKKERNQFA